MPPKILYISNVNLEGSFLPGVVNKIKGQVKAMKEEGFAVSVLYPCGKGQVVLKTNEEQKKFSGSREVNPSAGFFSKLTSHLKVSIFGSISFTDCYPEILNAEIDTIYLRFYLPGIDLIKFLKKIKKDSPSTLILLEYPTLNVATEMRKRSWVSRIAYFINKKKIELMNEKADFIITLTKDKTLFGKPAIFMPNGISMDEVKPVEKPSFTDQIILIGVTSDCAFYHGFDRVIKGIADYNIKNNKINVLFKIVSNPLSNYIDYLKGMVKELGVANSVVFEGMKTKSELIEDYTSAHIGIGTLALHRVGMMDNYSLKHREYAAFGLPFIMSKGDDQFENSEFVFLVERDDEHIPIDKVVDFYLAIRKKYIEYPFAFRQTIEGDISWKKNMRKVFEIIRKK